MIICGCGGVGFTMIRYYKKQEKTLQDLCHSLEWMILELDYHMPALPAVCRGAANISTGCISKVFLCLADELDRQITPDAHTCMMVAISRVSDIPERTIVHLKDLGTSIGKFDLQGQIVGLKTILIMCKGELQVMKKGSEVRLRNYQTLGLCAGAALVILLL